MLFQAFIGLLLGTIVLADIRNVTDCQNRTVFANGYDYDLDVKFRDCDNDTDEDDGDNGDCDDWGIDESPCLNGPCSGNSSCVDLTSNGTVCDEDEWESFLNDNYNMSISDAEDSGDGYACLGLGDDDEDEDDYDEDDDDSGCDGDQCGNPCLEDDTLCDDFSNATCYDLTSNGTNWNESDWADTLLDELDIMFDINDPMLGEGFYCYSGNSTGCDDCDEDDNDEDDINPCDLIPCDNSTCIDLTANGTQWSEDEWENNLMDLLNITYDKNDTELGEGYYCFTEGDDDGDDDDEDDEDELESPCLSDPCGNATCIDLTSNGTNWNESDWSELLWDEFEMEYNGTEGYACLLPCDFKPCDAFNATCVDLTANGTVWNDNEWADWLMDNHEMDDDNETYGYECILDDEEEELESPCLSDPCGNATCIDLTANGTIWNETYWSESLWDEFEVEYNNDTEGYECLLPCDFRPCDNLNATCVDLTENGTVWNDNDWADWLMDNHEMEDDNETYGYECIFDEEERIPPCDLSPCGNATCVDLTQNGTVWNETYFEEIMWDMYEIIYNNETEGYECMVPCDFRPCDMFNATCIDLTENGTVWNPEHWDDWLQDEFSMEYNSDSHGYECLMDPPCDSGPCDHLNLTCVDLTANGTVWNMTLWEELLWEEYEIEYDNSTYGYECVDDVKPPPCDAKPCVGIEGSTCVDLTANATIWNETFWAEYLWDNYRMEYDNTTEGYECYIEAPLPCPSMICNKFEECEETFLGEGTEDWVEVNGVWSRYRGDCVFNKALCPAPIGEAVSPVPSGKFPIHWKGAKPSFLGKQIMETSEGNRIFRYNLKNTDKQLVTDIRKDGYIGFMYFSQKSCGGDFLNALMDYKVNFRIMDFSNLYEVAYRHKRTEGSKTGVVLQFRQHTAIDCKAQSPPCVQKYTDMGTAAHDQFYIEIIGNEGVDFTYKKDWMTCHSKVALGSMKQDYGVIDQANQPSFTEELVFENPTYNFNSTYNYAQCASLSYTFW